MSRLTDENKEIISLLGNNESYWLSIYFKLKEYEELEEKGLLLKLPCKVGDTVYSIEVYEIQEFVATRFDVDKNGIHAFHKNIYIGEMGNSVFATKEEAEQELKRLECAENE